MENKFKYIVVANGSLEARKRFVEELGRIGYDITNKNSLCLDDRQYKDSPQYCITVNYENDMGFNIPKSGRLNGFSNCGEYWVEKGMKYQFEIDDENEFQTALAIAAIRDDEIPHIGEWVIANSKRRISGTVIGPNDSLHRIDCVTGINFSTEGYTGTKGVATSLYYETKATPEEIIQHFKTNKSTNMNKKIIGYKCPADYYKGSLPKGTILLRSVSSKEYSYSSRGFVCYLPAEIVEAWEPVYENDTISLGGYTAIKEGDTVAFGCQKFDIVELLAYRKLLASVETKAELTIHGTKITIKILDSLIEML